MLNDEWGGSYQPGGSVDGAPFIFVYMLLCFVFVRKKKVWVTSVLLEYER